MSERWDKILCLCCMLKSKKVISCLFTFAHKLTLLKSPVESSGAQVHFKMLRSLMSDMLFGYSMLLIINALVKVRL